MFGAGADIGEHDSAERAVGGDGRGCGTALAHAKVDGILGYPAFSRVLLTINYPDSVVSVEKGELPEGQGYNYNTVLYKRSVNTGERFSTKARTASCTVLLVTTAMA